MITFTTNAVDHLKTVLETDECVRVAVVGGGCAGMSYMMDIVKEGDEEDILVEADTIKIFIDPHSAGILANTSVDFVKTLQKQGFVFNNPNSNTSCGCGLSFN